MRTQVAIIGSGPAGLMLGHLLRQAGIQTVIIEHRSRQHVEGRIRAGVLERTTTDIIERIGLADRLHREGIVERGFNLADGERLVRIAVEELTGKQLVVYGQTELTRDLIEAAPERDLEIMWEAQEVVLRGVDGRNPSVHFRLNGSAHEVQCDFIAGCDGYHGPSRKMIPAAIAREYERSYPFGWLGILSDVPPCHHELIYSNHGRGFALASMRSLTRSRYYIQVPLDENVADWPDERLWDELALRLGPQAAAGMTRGPSIEKSIAPLRSYVFEPMAHGRLFLAGDSAHIVPPTGAKGLNLAAADVRVLAEAIAHWYATGSGDLLDGYSEACLRRVWRAQHFSWWMTTLLHTFESDDAYGRRLQRSYLDYVTSSEAAATTLAENYVGMPFEPFGSLEG